MNSNEGALRVLTVTCLIISGCSGGSTIPPPDTPPVISGVTPTGVVGPPGKAVVFTAQVSESPTSWEWTIDGAAEIQDQTSDSPTVRFPHTGEFHGSVVAANAVGSSTPISFTVHVTDPAAPLWSSPSLSLLASPGDIRTDVDGWIGGVAVWGGRPFVAWGYQAENRSARTFISVGPADQASQNWAAFEMSAAIPDFSITEFASGTEQPVFAAITSPLGGGVTLHMGRGLTEIPLSPADWEITEIAHEDSYGGLALASVPTGWALLGSRRDPAPLPGAGAEHPRMYVSGVAHPAGASDWSSYDLEDEGVLFLFQGNLATVADRLAACYTYNPANDPPGTFDSIRVAVANTALPLAASDWTIHSMREDVWQIGADMTTYRDRLALTYASRNEPEGTALKVALAQVPYPDGPEDWLDTVAYPYIGLGPTIQVVHGRLLIASPIQLNEQQATRSLIRALTLTPTGPQDWEAVEPREANYSVGYRFPAVEYGDGILTAWSSGGSFYRTISDGPW